MTEQLILVGGKSGTGKSASLKDIKDPEGVIYLNCENGKKTPFKNKFKEIVITDPMVVFQAFKEAENMPEVHTIVIDSLTFLMDMYESTYVIHSENTMKSWGNYAEYFKDLLKHCALSTKTIIFTAHTAPIQNEAEFITETLVKIKGSIMAKGVEAYFTNVISAKKVPISKLVYKNSMLNISDTDKMLGYKHVFQTNLTKETVDERLRGPIGMWSLEETYIDNNMQHVLDRLRSYYE